MCINYSSGHSWTYLSGDVHPPIGTIDWYDQGPALSWCFIASVTAYGNSQSKPQPWNVELGTGFGPFSSFETYYLQSTPRSDAYFVTGQLQCLSLWQP
jgi:hypothetical protein